MEPKEFEQKLPSRSKRVNAERKEQRRGRLIWSSTQQGTYRRAESGPLIDNDRAVLRNPQK